MLKSDSNKKKDVVYNETNNDDEFIKRGLLLYIYIYIYIYICLYIKLFSLIIILSVHKKILYL